MCGASNSNVTFNSRPRIISCAKIVERCSKKKGDFTIPDAERREWYWRRDNQSRLFAWLCQPFTREYWPARLVPTLATIHSNVHQDSTAVIIWRQGTSVFLTGLYINPTHSAKAHRWEMEVYGSNNVDGLQNTCTMRLLQVAQQILHNCGWLLLEGVACKTSLT